MTNALVCKDDKQQLNSAVFMAFLDFRK